MEAKDSIDLLKFSILEMGDFRLSAVVKDNVVTDLCTSNGRCTLHHIGYHKPPWVKW